MTELLLSAFILGLIFKITPGPVFAEAVRSGIKGGFRSAFAVQFGAILGDTMWALVGILGIGYILHLDYLQTPIYILSAFYLLWLSWISWKDSRQHEKLSFDVSYKDNHRAVYSGITLSLTNPQNILIWAAIGSALATLGLNAPTISDYVVFCLVFILSTGLWAYAISKFIDQIFRKANKNWIILSYRLCSFTFLILAFLVVKKLI